MSSLGSLGRTFISGESISEPEKIVQANLWRDAAVSASIPYRTYTDQLHPSSP
jgi:hypothetical protein